jgi:Rrf2 family iron-sulfur cluster assembly transcriptional regulator
MLELAISNPNKAVKLADISEKHGISLSYLEQLFAALRAKGLVTGRRGPGGGYVLGVQARDISISDVICAVDEWVEYTQQKLRSPASNVRSIQLSTRNLWDDLSLKIFDFLADISLQDVVDQKWDSVEQFIPSYDDMPAYTDRAA